MGDSHVLDAPIVGKQASRKLNLVTDKLFYNLAVKYVYHKVMSRVVAFEVAPFTLNLFVSTRVNRLKCFNVGVNSLPIIQFLLG